MLKSLSTLNRFLVLVIILFTHSFGVSAQTETLPTGSFIINMGATNPNTIANGLKPYGLIYDLIRNYNVPVKWVIKQDKVKDGIDFIYNGVTYRGGTFVIPGSFRSTAVNNRITYWISQGVVGVTTTGAISLDVTNTLLRVPKWTLDSKNGSIAEKYLINAGINNTAFPNAYNWKDPQLLDNCDDLFVMPHADPVWSTHSRLLSWNRLELGSIWAACHAVSALENTINPANSTEQMNFLSTRTAATTPLPWPNNSLKLWGNHADGSAPYTHQFPADPISQYMGVADAGLQNGSEQIYIPKQSTDPGGATRWRPGTKMIVYDPSQIDIPSPDLANGNIAAAIVYGRAFDDPTRGWVMYEAGHSHDKGTEGVAAMRAFFNFSFFQVLGKAPQITLSGITKDTVLTGGTTVTGINILASSAYSASFTYQWTSSCGGTFSNATGATTNFTAPAVAGPTPCVISVKVTDNCGRVAFESIPLMVVTNFLPPSLQNDIRAISNGCPPGPVLINVMENDTDPQGTRLTFTSLNGPGSPVNAGVWSSNAAGRVSFSPDPNFSGVATITYTVTNSLGLSSNATISISVGSPDLRGCFPNQIWGIANTEFMRVPTVIAQNGLVFPISPIGDVNDPRLDDKEFTFSSNDKTTGNYINLGISTANLLSFQLPYTLNIGDTVIIHWGKAVTSGTTVLSMQQSATAAFSGTVSNYSITGAGNMPTSTRYPITANGMNYILVNTGAGTTQPLYIDALEFEDWSCVSRQPQAVNDNYSVLEDVPTVLTVLENDSDPTGSGMKVTSLTAAPTNGGRVSINNDGTLTFVSGNDMPGTSTFSYKVCNNQGYCSVASVTVTILADGCPAGQYRPNPPGGAITKVFQFQFAGTNAASANSIASNFRDAYVKQDGATNNYGTNNSLHTGQLFSSGQARRSLLYFNISEIPVSAIVQSASFSMLRTGGDGDVQNVLLHRLTRNIIENEVTWNNAVTAVPWTAAGGDMTAILQTTSVNSSSIRYSWNLAPSSQIWASNPANNFGILLKTDELLGKRHHFGSKENTTIANRPSLSITYVVPDPCAVVPNRPPLANPDNVTTNAKTPISVAVLANDTDPDVGQSVTLLSLGTVTNGSAYISGNNVVFTPTQGFNGLATVVYNIYDNGAGNLQDQSIINITVTNAPPTAVNDMPAGVNSGTPQVVNIGINDYDYDSSPLTWVIYRDGKNIATPTVISTMPSTITYTPVAGFTGKDTVFYYVAEPISGCNVGARDSAYVVFNVLNRTPTANPDSRTVSPCQPTKINLLINDTDPEGNNLRVTNISALSIPAAGSLINNNDGTVTFTPATGFTGVVTFTYTVTDDGVAPATSPAATVTITVTTVTNNPPVAVNDVQDPSNMDEIVFANVIGNDYDPDDNLLTQPVITVNPIHGTAVVQPNGQIKYTPNPGFYGTDQLTYEICDIVINSGTCIGVPTLCATAVVSFTIVAPNSVLAINDENSTWTNTPVSGAIMNNDYDAQDDYPLVFLGYSINNVLQTSGTHTIAGFDASGNPVANAGTITIGSNGTYSYTPANNFSGVVSIPYSIKDANVNTAYDTAELRITVNPLPAIANSVIANNDECRVFAGTVISNNLFANDWDPQGNLFTVSSYKYDTNGDGIADATGTIGALLNVGGKTTSGKQISKTGTLIINADGTYTFTPEPDFHGSVEVFYTICDNAIPQACATAILHIDVMIDANGAANNKPQPGDDFAYTNFNTAVTSSFILNDSDPNNDGLSLNGVAINTAGAATPIGAAVTTVKGGTVQYFANGTFTYTPPTGYVGPDSTGYEICDITAVAPQPLCNRAFLHLLVGVKNSTDAINDEHSTWQAVNVSGNVLTNDYDPEKNVQTFGSFLLQNKSADLSSGSIINGLDKTGTPVANAGTISFDVNGNYTFMPDPAFIGTVSVPYRLCDNGNLSACDSAYLTITVDPLPTTGINTVIANNDENLSYGAAVSGNLFDNDRDPQSHAFTVTGFTGGTVGLAGTVSGVDVKGNPVANAGTLTINANGTYTYTPTVNFVGSIDLSYTITDALGATSTAKINIDVIKDPNGPANDPPFAGDDFGYTTINKSVAGNFISNDNDQNGNAVSFNGVPIVPAGAATAIGSPETTAAGGSVQFYANGTYLYLPPAGYVGPDRIAYTICDITAVEPQPICAGATIHLLVGPGINISGTVWNDDNGDAYLNGVESVTNAGNTLYVNLIDGSGNVAAKTMVAANGTYSFLSTNPNVNYTLVLSTTQGTIGQPAPAAILPAGWVYTGENRNGAIDGGTLGVIDSRSYGFTNTVNFDFGIERLPNSDDHTAMIPQPSENDFITLNGGSNPPILSGSDPEDCNAGCDLSNRSVIIDAVPANAQLYYNAVLVSNGQQINNFDPALLQLKMTAATIGAVTTSFQYSFVDAANKKDPTPAFYTLNWLYPLPVILSSFTGMPEKCDADLQWITEQEINTDKYVIEQSNNGLNFKAVAVVKAANSSTGKSYQKTIVQPDAVMYYRLKMLDSDGKFSYSQIITIRTGCSINDFLSVYPNPVDANLTVNFQTAYKGSANLVIKTILGQQILSAPIKISATVNTINLNMSNFIAGVYTVYLTNEAGVKIGEIQKIIKK